MSKDRTMLEAVHEATHRMPGVPPHRDQPQGHQGTTRHGRPFRGQHGHGGSHHQGSAAAHGRPPRVLVGWQNWIAGLLSRRAG
jgi:hypothetical protein